MLNLLLTLVITAAPQAKPATNTLCPVTGQKVTPNNQVVVVRGQEYRICCPGCDNLLKTKPDTYLGKDGKPKNAK
jgi:hypothetical protein